jgi:flagellar capping protein FliD
MSGTTRISGLISGMDVDSLVKAALQPKKQAMQQIENKMTYDSLKKETLQTV